MSLFLIVAIKASLACSATEAALKFDVPATVQSAENGTELLRELSGVLLKDGKVTLDTKSGLIQGTQEGFGDYRISLDLVRGQLALSCGGSQAATTVTTKRHARGRRFASTSAQKSRCEREVSAMIQSHLASSR